MKWRAVAWSTFAALLFATATFFAFGQEYLRNREIAREISVLEAEHERLTGQRLDSLRLLDELSSRYWLEGQVRKQGYAAPGETMIVIPDDETTDVAAFAPVEEEPASVAKLWWWYFFAPEKLRDV